jgi:hypothetical protein
VKKNKKRKKKRKKKTTRNNGNLSFLQMRRGLGGPYALAALFLSLAGDTSAFSFSRTLHDVEQDVAEDASLYSQEMRLSAPELSLAESPQVYKISSSTKLRGRDERPSESRTQLNDLPLQKNQLEKYVTVKSSPSGYVTVPKG